MKNILLVILIIHTCIIGFSQVSDPFEFSLTSTFKVKMAGSSLPFSAALKNISTDTVTTTYPSIDSRSIVIHFYKNGIELSQSVIWCGSTLIIPISLAPGAIHPIHFDLRDYYGYGLKPGNYSCHLTYTRKSGKIYTSPTMEFQLLPLSDFEKESYEEIKIISGFYEDKAVELGKAYLEKYEESIFANNVRMKIANTLRRSGRMDESIPYYRAVYASKEATRSEKSEAYFYEAHAFFKKGDKARAIKVLEKSPYHSNPEELIRHWGPTVQQQAIKALKLLIKAN